MVFTLDGQLYALELATVHRVVHALEVTPLPGAPDTILGVINVHGELIPVVSLRRRFRIPEREIKPSDQFIIAHMNPQESGGEGIRTVALVVDAVTTVRKVTGEEIAAGAEIGSNLAHVRGIAGVGGDLILIYNLARCLSLHELEMLDNALAQSSANG